uniref:35 kDa SR repressor protein n=1 Tax=Cajanus cajan TaxID=3821 RepID=A0A151U3V5_CAJCA|nr:35 kDa SR repressor protein [Cajanus cajan]
MRGRSYSYSPSPPRRYGRRRRSPSPRGRYRGRDRDLPTSLLVRNLHRDCRPDDLHGPFGQFGPLKDVYLPRDYYTGEPRGFGFVQYVDPADAADAKYHMDGQIFLGREITVVFAEENRKKPAEMRARERRRHQAAARTTCSKTRTARFGLLRYLKNMPLERAVLDLLMLRKKCNRNGPFFNQNGPLWVPTLLIKSCTGTARS